MRIKPRTRFSGFLSVANWYFIIISSNHILLRSASFLLACFIKCKEYVINYQNKKSRGIICRRVWSVTTTISNRELTWAMLIKINYAFLLVHDIMTLISFSQILARLQYFFWTFYLSIWLGYKSRGYCNMLGISLLQTLVLHCWNTISKMNQIVRRFCICILIFTFDSEIVCDEALAGIEGTNHAFDKELHILSHSNLLSNTSGYGNVNYAPDGILTTIPVNIFKRSDEEGIGSVDNSLNSNGANTTTKKKPKLYSWWWSQLIL